MFRQKFLGFTGAVMIAYGIILAIQGNGLTVKLGHAAAGVPLWCGLLFVLTGCANLTQVFGKKRKQRDDMPFSFTVIICNFIAMLVAALCIGLVTWGAWTWVSATGALTVQQQDNIETYTAILIANIILLFLSIIAMFVDCCSGTLFGPSAPVERPQMYYDYPPRQVPAIYKA